MFWIKNIFFLQNLLFFELVKINNYKKIRLYNISRCKIFKAKDENRVRDLEETVLSSQLFFNNTNKHLANKNNNKDVHCLHHFFTDHFIFFYYLLKVLIYFFAAITTLLSFTARLSAFSLSLAFFE